MPNWVSNIVKCNNIDALRQLRDFNRIVPQPLVLDIICGGISNHVEWSFAQGKTWRDLLEDPVFLDAFDEEKQCPFEPRYTAAQAARRYWLGYKLHGYLTWYEWCCAKWVTKWNAIDYCLGPDPFEVRFKTAFEHPFPLIKVLSRQFPAEVFSVSYADETIGYKAGEYRIQNGELLSAGKVANRSREAYEIAFRHWDCAEDYVLHNGTYRHIGDDYIDDDESSDEGAPEFAPSA